MAALRAYVSYWESCGRVADGGARVRDRYRSILLKIHHYDTARICN